MAFTYLYRCPQCSAEKEVEAETAICDCGWPMDRERIVHNGNFKKTDFFEPHYDHGLGCWVKNKDDKRQQISKINSETGSDIIELGNEDPAKYIKPKESNWEDV